MATTVEVGNIQARITATTGRFDSAIRRVNTRLGSVKTSTRSLQDRIRDLNKSFDDLHKRLERVAQTGERMQKAFAAGLVGLVGAGGVLVKLASDANETRNKFRESFGDMTDETLKWVNTTAAAYGRSRVQVQQFAADLQAVLAPTLENREQAAEMSKALTTLAFDLASFHNVAERETLERLRSGLLGSTEAVDQLGINLRQTALEQEMLRLGWRKSYAQLTEQEKILLRFNVIMRATRDAQGDVIRNSREFANASRALTSALQDAGDRLGQRFLPRVTELTLRATQIVQAFNQLDDEQVDLIARFGALSAAVMAGGLAFSTLLVILPQFVKGLQIVMGVMSVFASPWVLGVTAVIVAAYLLKRAWDENLGGVQERTETVTASVRRSWERLAAFFSGEPSLFDLPALGPHPGARRPAFALPSLPAPDWDRTIDDATARATEAWSRAKASIAALPAIELPAVEWPGWPEIDTEPFVAQWERVRAEIAALEAPPIPAGVETWIDRVTESLKRSPGGQVVLNIGELAREVRAGEKSLGEAVREAIEGNIAIPLGAAAISLLPIAGGWKLALAGVALALSFIPGVDLEGLSGLASEVWKQIVAAFQRDADVAGGRIEVSDPMLETVKQSFEQLGRALGAAVAETLIFLFEAVTLSPDFVSAAVSIGRFVAENFVGPFIRGFVDEFTKRLVDRLPQGIKDAWKAASDAITGRDEVFVQTFADTQAAAQQFREATDDRVFTLRSSLSTGERILGWLRARLGIRPEGTPATQYVDDEFQRGTPWTGWGPLNEIAGVVHRQEAVIPADVLREGPAAVLDFLGAPGFQGGKNDVPLFGAAAVQSEADRLTQLNEESLGQLTQMSGILGGLSDVWDKAGAKLKQIAADIPMVRDLVDLVRTLVGLVRQSQAPGGGQQPTATLILPPRMQLAQTLKADWANFVKWAQGRWQVAQRVFSGEAAAQFFKSLPDRLAQLALTVRSGIVQLPGMVSAQAGAGASALGKQAVDLAEQFGALMNPLRMVASTFGELGPLSAAIAAMMEPLAPIIGALLEPIRLFGEAFGQALVPILEALFPIFKGVAIVASFLGEVFFRLLAVVSDVVAGIANFVGGIIKGIGDFLKGIKVFGYRPFEDVGKSLSKTGQNIINFGKGAQEFADKSRESADLLKETRSKIADLSYDEAKKLAEMRDKTQSVNEALRNVPSGFKIALARFQAATPVQSFATGGYVPATPGGRIVRVAEGGEGEYIVPESKMGRSVVVNVDLRNSTIYGVNDLDRRITTVVKKAMQQERMVAYGVT